ncbi:MAG TPA: hypothetical protein VLA53_03105 [Nitrosopumilaceae archaeon]|nr:hypothetical protein [Nitrosopumilaceae archaeon]
MSQSQKHKKFAISAAIIGAVAATLVALYFAPLQTELTTIPPTQEEKERNDALGVAQRFIVTSPTFAFDGDINTLDTEYVGATKSLPPQYMIRIAFDSAHGGFGNREGQILTQVITPHKMDITVSEGTVISAVTDEVWDELNNQYVLKKPQPKLQSDDEPVVPFEGTVTDYSSLVAAIKSRGILVEYVDELAAETSSFSVPTKVISVGGADVQVFEFQSESDANAASLTVSDDGTEIGTSIIHWIGPPHFYTQGKLIVLYVGENSEITSLLEDLLGPQFAGF